MKQPPRPRVPVTPTLGMHNTPFLQCAGLIHPNLSTPPSLGSGGGCYTSPTTQIFSQTCPNAANANLVPHSQWPAQNYVPNMFGNPMPLPDETCTLPYPNAGFGFIPFQSQGAYPIPVPYQDQVFSSGSTHNTSNAVTALPAVPAQPSFRSLLENGAEVHEPPIVPKEGSQNEIKLLSSYADTFANSHGPAQESNESVPEPTQLQSLFLQDNPADYSDLHSLALLDIELGDWLLPDGSPFDLGDFERSFASAA